MHLNTARLQFVPSVKSRPNPAPNIRGVSPSRAPSVQDAFLPSEKFVMGGDESPCFHNGKVMTIREAKALSGVTQQSATPAPQGKSTWEAHGLDPKMVMGGPDSPCFYNGKVMTIREAKALAAGG